MNETTKVPLKCSNCEEYRFIEYEVLPFVTPQVKKSSF